MLRWIGRDISVPHRVEHFVAEIAVQQLVIVAHGLYQPRTIGVPVNPKQDLAFFLRAVEDFSQNGLVISQDAALKIVLLPREITHLVCRIGGGNTRAAISRVRFTSTISSPTGGLLPPRPSILESRPHPR